MAIDPLVEMTAPHVRRAARRAQRERTPSRLERWAWSEIPAYRLGLTLGYAVMIYFGISAFIAGVPAFDIAAPEGWTPIWAAVLVLGGAVGITGSINDKPRLRAIELVGSSLLSLTLVTYAGTILAIAYGVGDSGRAAAGSGFVGLAVPPVIRMLWLIAKALADHKASKLAKVAAALTEVP